MKSTTCKTTCNNPFIYLQFNEVLWQCYSAKENKLILILEKNKIKSRFWYMKILASNLEIMGTLDSRYGLEDECQDITFRIITTFDGRGRCVVVSFYLLPRLLKNCWYTMTPSTRQKLKYHTFFWSCLAFDLLEFFYSESQF